MSQADLSTDAANPVTTNSFSVSPDVAGGFVDRRATGKLADRGGERRQFGSSHAGLSDDGRDLALAIDQYKVEHHRRYLTCDEMLTVLKGLGYSKQAE
jgi:hypothetical protein